MADAVAAPVEQPMPWWVKPALAAMILALFGFALVTVMIDKGNANQLLMLGVINAMAGGVVGYYLGSSASSDKKDNAIAANTAALAASTPPATAAPSEPTEPSDEVKALAAKVS